MAKVFALPAFEAELAELHPGFLAQLQQHEAEIQVQRQMLLRDLIEHGLGTVAVGFLAETPQQAFERAFQSDRIAHRDPVVPGCHVGQEGLPVVGPHQGLVAEQRPETLGVR